jgi:TonB family protein
MFEESLPGPKKNGRRSSDRAAGVLVTLLVHVLLGFVIYHGRFTVKILPFQKKEVRNVVIVPPLKVAIPTVVGGRDLSEVPGGPGGESQRSEASREPAEVPQEEPAGAPAGEPEQTAGTTPPPPPAGSAIPSLSSRFQQSLTIHGKSELTIPLAPPGTPAGPPGIHGGVPLPDFTKYGRTPYGSGEGYGPGRGRGGGTGGRQRVGMSIPLKGYDLLPWATVVIDRLQLHWSLPAVTELPENAKISMIVVIKKSGELDSIEILEGTTIEVLDQAALEAVRSSLPFPPLPADFPGDLLEITFEFVYND